MNTSNALLAPNIPHEIFRCLIKRDGVLLIKGLSLDKKEWYLIPKEYRSVDYHPELAKYHGIKSALKQKKVNRASGVRVTKEINSIYLNEKQQFMFNIALLTKDNNLTNDSIVNQLKESEAIKRVPDVFTSSTPKKPKISFNLTDLSEIRNSILSNFGKFKLFNEYPEVYIGKIINHLFESNFNLEDLVNSFFSFLKTDLHSWFFSVIYKQGFVFDDFKAVFIEEMHR